MRAVECDDLEIASLLISHGADLDTRDNTGNTALIKAVFQGKYPCCEAAIGRRRMWEFIVPYSSEINAFEYVCRGYCYAPQRKEVLADGDGELADARELQLEENMEGESDLEEQIGEGDNEDWIDQDDNEDNIDGDDREEDVADGDDDEDAMDEDDRENRVDEDSDGEGATPGTDVKGRDIDAATAVELIGLVVSAKAEVNRQPSFGAAPVVVAASRPPVLQKLLHAGAHVDTRRQNGETALIVAVQAGARESVELLLQAKADVNAMDFDHATALSYAVEYGDVEIVRLLVDAGAQVEMGYSVIIENCDQTLGLEEPDVVRALLDGQADVHKVRYDSSH